MVDGRIAMLPAPRLEKRLAGDVPLWTDDALFELLGVRIAFTTRAGGESVGPYASLNLGAHVDDDADIVMRNRAHVLEVLDACGLPYIVPQQVHGVHMEVVATPDDALGVQQRASEGADAILATCQDVAVQLSFADCLPLIIVSPTGHFAVVHAGWRGALAGIAGLACRELARLDAEAGAVPSQFNAYIGPYIHEECFETGAEIVQSFVEAYGPGVVGDSGNVSIAAAVTCDLVRAGFEESRIADVDACTMCHPDELFSFRAAGGVCGRHGAIAFARER